MLRIDTVGDCPFFPSRTVVVVVLPSAFSIVIVWVPFLFSLTETVGDFPSRTVVSIMFPFGFVITIV